MKRASAKAAMTGVLGALALCLSFLENLLPPLPMTPPGFRLGLSNLATMYAAGSLGLPCALFLAVLKGGFAFLTRGAAAGLMSLSGGLFSTLCVWLLWRKTKTPFLMLGVCGALAHNAAQLAMARVLTSSAVVFYIPFLLLFGILTGVLTGTVLRLTLPSLERLEKVLGRKKD